MKFKGLLRKEGRGVEGMNMNEFIHTEMASLARKLVKVPES